MSLLGMPEAGKRLGISGDSARRAFVNAGIPLVKINERAWAVTEEDLNAFKVLRTGYVGRGRPCSHLGVPNGESAGQK
jgi:hypothetical protein